MPHPRLLCAAGALLAFALTAAGDLPEPPATNQPAGSLPVGRWSLAFANGVTEVCEIREDGSASVVEPRRSCGGRAVARDGAVVITCEDDRVERWTPVGPRMVVEHWYPGSRFPCGEPVLGIAERVQ